MRLLVDVDGVQADIADAFLRLLAQRNGVHYTQDDWTDWCPVKSGLCTTEESESLFKALGPYIELLPEVPGAGEALALLRNAGHQVITVTAPQLTPEWLHCRAQWLLRAGYHKEEIVFAYDKALVQGDILIDDHPKNCASWAAAHPNGTALLFDAPWNQGPVAAKNVRRVHGWAGVLDAIDQLTRAQAPVHAAGCFGYPYCHRGEACRG